MEKVCLGLYLQLLTNPGSSHTSPGSEGQQRRTTTGAPGLSSRKEVQKPECNFGRSLSPEETTIRYSCNTNSPTNKSTYRQLCVVSPRQACYWQIPCSEVGQSSSPYLLGGMWWIREPSWWALQYNNSREQSLCCLVCLTGSVPAAYDCTWIIRYNLYCMYLYIPVQWQGFNIIIVVNFLWGHTHRSP